MPPTGSPLPTTPVEKFTFTRRTQKIQAGEPTIVGRPTVGHTVTADPGNWSPKSARLSYQWLRDGLPIAGATSSSTRSPRTISASSCRFRSPARSPVT